MARIYKRDRVWYLDIRVSGWRIRKRIGTSKKIAQLALQDAVVKAERQEFGFAKKDISIPKFIEQFLEYSAANHRSATTNRYRAVTDHFKARVPHSLLWVVTISDTAHSPQAAGAAPGNQNEPRSGVVKNQWSLNSITN